MKNLLAKLVAAKDEKIVFTPDDRRVACAVLLYRVIMVDGRVRSEEMRRYREILQDNLDVGPDELPLFEKMVIDQSSNEHSLFPHTEIVSKMSLETKREILEFMKQISVSDNELHEFEINLVTRTSQMLGLDKSEGEF